MQTTKWYLIKFHGSEGKPVYGYWKSDKTPNEAQFDCAKEFGERLLSFKFGNIPKNRVKHEYPEFS